MLYCVAKEPVIPNWVQKASKSTFVSFPQGIRYSLLGETNCFFPLYKETPAKNLLKAGSKVPHMSACTLNTDADFTVKKKKPYNLSIPTTWRGERIYRL